MSDIVLRYSESEHSLRSTGDLPGVVVFAFPEGHPSLAIDYAYDPELYPLPAGATMATMHERGISPTAKAVPIEDLVEGCIGADELRHLYALAGQALRDGLAIFLGAQQFDVIRETVDYVEAIAYRIEKRLEAEAA